jgi:hypothetical protein
MTSQKELIENAQKEYGIGGGDSNFFRFDKKGTYKFRVLTPCYPLATYFFGAGIKPKIAYSGLEAPKDKEGNPIKPTVKFVGYVLDREDGQVKLAELSYSIIKSITAMQEDDEWAFADFPMPYDIKVAYDKDASPTDVYKVMASPNKTPLTDEEAKQLKEKMEKQTPEQYIEKRKDKQREKDASDKAFDDDSYVAPVADEDEPPH